jgi:hypothetical protein
VSAGTFFLGRWTSLLIEMIQPVVSHGEMLQLLDAKKDAVRLTQIVDQPRPNGSARSRARTRPRWRCSSRWPNQGLVENGQRVDLHRVLVIDTEQLGQQYTSSNRGIMRVLN